MFFAGIDWANTHYQVAVVDSHGLKKANVTVPSSREGLEFLKDKLLQIAGKPEAVACIVACIIETKPRPLIQFLLEEDFRAYPVVDRRRNPSGTKSDTLDARLLAELGRTDIHHPRQLN